MLHKKFKTWMRILALILIFLIGIGSGMFIMVVAAPSDGCTNYTESEDIDPSEWFVEETKSLISEPITYPDVQYVKMWNEESCKQQINDLLDVCYVIESAMASGEYTEEAVTVMYDEASRIYSIIALVEGDINYYGTMDQEHYYSAQVYRTLRANGYSDAAACGIIGNMMWETGGGTLDLKPTAYSSNRYFYGICQWHKGYYPEVFDKDFDYQLQFLLDTIEDEFDEFGFCYKSNFDLEDFKNMEDPAQAALAFAKVYERCNSGSYGIRKNAAKTAYQYFMGEV